MSKTRDPINGITEGVIWKQLLLFFFPIVLGTFFQQLYNTADAIIVGKFVGKEALAAVGGTTGTLINLLVGFFVGVSSGASVIISQFYGARKGEEVSRSVHTTVMLAILSGAVLTVLGMVFSESVLLLMGTPPEVMEYALSYIHIYFLGMIPSLIYNIGSGILRAVGDSRRPLFFLICATMTNIVLDVLFVLGFNWGVAGAAAATVGSQVLSAVLVVITLRNAPSTYRLRLRRLKIHRDMLMRIVRIGLPAGLQSVMYSLSNIIIQAGVNGFGTDPMAAYTAYGKLDGLYWMTINAFGVAITTFVGQNFGARHYDRMKKSIHICLAIAAGVTLVMSAFMLLTGRQLLSLFTDDAQVLDTGCAMIRLIVPAFITYIFIEILSGAMRGAGDSFVPTMMTLTGVCLLRVFWVMFIVPMHRELNTLLLSYPVTWIITSAMFLVYYLRGKWLTRCIAMQERQE